MLYTPAWRIRYRQMRKIETASVGGQRLRKYENALNMYREAIELYPSADSVMDSIVPNYVIGMVYGCLVEAYASEHNARMMAMKAATDSAES